MIQFMVVEKAWQQGHRPLVMLHLQSGIRDEGLCSACFLLFTKIPDYGLRLLTIRVGLPAAIKPPPRETLLYSLVILNPVRLITKNRHLMHIL